MEVYTDSLGVRGDPTWLRAQGVSHPAPTGSLMTRPTRPRRSTPHPGNPYAAGGARDATASTDTSPSAQRAYGTTAHRATASQKRKRRRRRRKRTLKGRAHLSLVCRTWTWTLPYRPRVTVRQLVRTHGLTAGWVGRGRAATGRAAAPSRSASRLTTCPFKTWAPPPDPHSYTPATPHPLTHAPSSYTQPVD